MRNIVDWRDVEYKQHAVKTSRLDCPRRVVLFLRDKRSTIPMP